MEETQAMNSFNIEEVQALFEKVVAYKKAKPWEKMVEAQIFAVEDPETHEVGYCSVTGILGQHLGLTVYLGEAGRQAIYNFFTMAPNTINSPIVASKYILSQAALMCSFEDKEFLQEGDMEVLKLLNLRFRGKNAWPMCQDFRPGKETRQIKDGWESRFLTYALAQAIEVAKDIKRGKLVIEPITTAKQILYIYTETIDGERLNRRSWRAFDFEKQMNCIRPYIFKDEMLIKRIKGLKKNKQVLGCKQFILPIGVEVQKGEVDYPSNMVFYNSKLDQIEHMALVGDKETDGNFTKRGPHLLEQYANHIISKGERPKEIIVDEEATYQLLADFCKKAGITLRKDKVSKAIDEAVEDMIMGLSLLNENKGFNMGHFDMDDFNMEGFGGDDYYRDEWDDMSPMEFEDHEEDDDEIIDGLVTMFILDSINEFLNAPPRMKWSNKKKDECGDAIAMVIELLWQAVGEGPGMWTPMGIKEVLTQLIPLTYQGDLKTLEELPEHLSHYIKFIQQAGILGENKALLKAIEENKESMLNNFKAKNLFKTQQNGKVIPFKR